MASGAGRRVKNRRPAVAVFSGGGTGGHLYPALALAEAVMALEPGLDSFFIGARRGLEARVLPERGLDHLLLPVQGFRRDALWRNVGVLLDLARSLVATGEAFTRIRPKMVVVTGGYAGGPAGIMAGLMGIPLALQEQNALPGATTRVLSRWSRQIHLAFPEATGHLPKKARERARVSGNPVRAPLSITQAEARSHFGIDAGSRVILVVGGSQGAEALNEAVIDVIGGVVEGSLPRPEDVVLLWATGPMNLEGVQARLQALGNPGWVHAVDYIHDMPRALSAATLAVSRAGAMATSEFLSWGVPALLVPLPTAAADHQTRNAKSLAQAGVALHLPEAELTGAGMWAALNVLLDEPETLAGMAEAAKRRGRPTATTEIATALLGLMPGPYRQAGRATS